MKVSCNMCNRNVTGCTAAAVNFVIKHTGNFFRRSAHNGNIDAVPANFDPCFWNGFIARIFKNHNVNNTF